MPIANKFELVTKEPEEIMREYGQSGTVITAGEIWNADYNDNLEGRDGMLAWRELIRSDSTAKLCLDTVEQNIASTEWYIKPGGEDSIDEEVAELFKKMIFEDLETPWSKLIFNMMPFGYGCSLNEPIYDIVDSKLVIKDIRQRIQTSVDKWVSKTETGYGSYVNVGTETFNNIREYTKGNLLGMEQMLDDGSTYFIPKQILYNGHLLTKLFLISNEIEGENYWGFSIFRAAYRNWYFRDKLYKIHGMMTEKQGVAPVVAVVNPEMSDGDKSKIQEALKNFGKANQEKYIYLEAAKDMVTDVFVMDMKAGTVANSLEDSKEHKMSIAEAVDLDWKTNEGKGSYEKDLLRMNDFLERENTRAQLIADEFNRQILYPVVKYNFPNLESFPKLTFEKIQYENVPETTKVINELIQTKALTPDNELENTLRKKLGLKELPEDMEEIDRSTPLPTFGQPQQDQPEDEEDVEENQKKKIKESNEVKVTEKEKLFLRSINEQEKFLQDQYNKFEDIAKQTELEIQNYLVKKYERMGSKVENGMEIIKPNVKQGNEMQKWVDNRMQKLDKIYTGKEMEMLHKQSRDNARQFISSMDGKLATQEALSSIRAYIGGYLSNIKAWIFNEGRRIKEKIFDNTRQGVQKAEAIKQAKAIKLNSNILKLSAITHPRALYRKTVQEEANKEGIGNYKLVVPSNVLKTLAPLGITASYLYMIKTASEWNKVADDNNANVVGGMGLHHNSQEYYLPISDEELSLQRQISKDQRSQLI